MTSNILEFSKNEIEQLIVTEVRKRFKEALVISIDFEPRSEGGFCHCYWVPPSGN